MAYLLDLLALAERPDAMEALVRSSVGITAASGAMIVKTFAADTPLR